MLYRRQFMVTPAQKPNGLEKAFLGILLAIFGGIVLHAPLTVAFGTLLPQYELLIKSWKEVLMVIALALLVVVLIRRKQMAIAKEPLMIGIAVYAGLHVMALLWMNNGLLPSVAGLMIDVRYILFFVLVYIAVRVFPDYKLLFVKVAIAGALVVMTFALLQVFVLPVDVLKYIGYNINTIVPYLTVDQNTEYIRINSTMRGPNPLGAYAVIVLSAVAAWLLSRRYDVSRKPALIIAIVLFGGIVALWASYSRSALIAAVVALVIVIAVTTAHSRRRKILIGAGLVSLAAMAGLVLASGSSFVSNVVYHENPGESNMVNSNDGHIMSLQDGLIRMLNQPYGAGIGSTGSASLYGDNPLIIENQYLFIAHEVGWIGLILFVMIFIGVMSRLWQRRSDWLALAVFASGVGLAIINVLLPMWADDTVAIVWWGLAALAVGSRWHVVDSKVKKS
jgi:O-Antigen ligase